MPLAHSSSRSAGAVDAMRGTLIVLMIFIRHDMIRSVLISDEADRPSQSRQITSSTLAATWIDPTLLSITYYMTTLPPTLVNVDVTPPPIFLARVKKTPV